MWRYASPLQISRIRAIFVLILTSRLRSMLFLHHVRDVWQPDSRSSNNNHEKRTTLVDRTFLYNYSASFFQQLVISPVSKPFRKFNFVAVVLAAQ